MKKILFFVLFSYLINAQEGTHFNFGGEMDRIDCGNSTSVQITGNQLTLEAYIKVNSFQDESFKGTIINKEQNSPDNGYMLRVGGNGVVNFNIGNGSWNELNTPIFTINAGLWYHIAATYDGSQMKIYVNGNIVASQNVITTIGNASNNLFIGDWYDWLFPSTARNIDAQIDEIRVWNVARSANQINLSYSCELTGNEPGLVLYYKFNQGIGGGSNVGEWLIFDSSPFFNNGQLGSSILNGTTSNFLSGSAVDTGNTCTLDTSNFNLDSLIQIFPNPVASTLMIKNNSHGNISKIQVFDLLGKLLLESTQNIEYVDVSLLKSGVYFLEIYIDKMVVSNRFIKQ